MFLFRRNKTGWTFQVFFLFLRWNKQDNYTELSLSKIKSKYKQI